MTFRPEEVGESPTYGVYVDSLPRMEDKTRIMLAPIITLSRVIHNLPRLCRGGVANEVSKFDRG